MNHGRRAVMGLMLAALLGLPLFAQPQAQTDFRETVDLRMGGRLTLDTFKGSVQLLPWDREQVEIVARIVADESVGDEYGEASVEATRIEVSGSGSSVRIKSEYEEVPCEQKYTFFGRLFGSCSKILPYVHYEIHAPRELRLHIKDYKSTMEVSGFTGDFDIETYKGTLDGGELNGDLILQTYKGQVRLAALGGSFEIETYKGDVEVGLSGISGRSSVETYKGTVTVKLDEQVGLNLRADMGNRADFQSDFAFAVHTQHGTMLEGDINGGGPVLAVESYKGEIRIRKN